MAHQLTKAAEALTYRQLCIIKLSAVKEQFVLRSEDYREHGDFSRELLQVLYEYMIYTIGDSSISEEMLRSDRQTPSQGKQ